MQPAATSRNLRRDRGFFVGARFGGADGGAKPRRILLRRLPGLSHLSALPPDVRVGRQLFNATVEPSMADLFSGASAQITPFSFGTHAVRVVQRDGAPWFVAKAIVEPGGMLPRNTELANLAAACNQRLAEHLAYEARNNERKAVSA